MIQKDLALEAIKSSINSGEILNAYKINSRLKSEFLRLLFSLDLKSFVILDEELHPDQIICSTQTIKDILEQVDFCYFSLYGRKETLKSQSFDLKSYVNYYSQKEERVIQVGSKVIQILDGVTYLVKSINPAKKQAVIFNENTSVMMRVPLRVLVLTDKS